MVSVYLEEFEWRNLRYNYNNKTWVKFYESNKLDIVREDSHNTGRKSIVIGEMECRSQYVLIYNCLDFNEKQFKCHEYDMVQFLNKISSLSNQEIEEKFVVLEGVYICDRSILERSNYLQKKVCWSDQYTILLIDNKKDNTKVNSYMVKEVKIVDKKGGEVKMIDAITKVFEKTVDALLVEKWFGAQLKSDVVTEFVIKDHKDELLEKAKKLEEESKNVISK